MGGSWIDEPTEVATQCAEAVASAIGTGRGAAEAEADAAGVFGIDGDIGGGDIEDGFVRAEFEIEAAVGDLDGGNEGEREAARSAHALHKFDDIPSAVVALDEVEGGINEAEAGEANLPGEEFIDAQAGFEAAAGGERFKAVGGIFADGDVFEREAGDGENAVIDFFEADAAAEGIFEGLFDAGGEAGGVDEGGDDAEGDERQGAEHD